VYRSWSRKQQAKPTYHVNSFAHMHANSYDHIPDVMQAQKCSIHQYMSTHILSHACTHIKNKKQAHTHTHTTHIRQSKLPTGLKSWPPVLFCNARLKWYTPCEKKSECQRFTMSVLCRPTKKVVKNVPVIRIWNKNVAFDCGLDSSHSQPWPARVL